MNTFQSRASATVPRGHDFGRAVQRERDQAGGSTWLEFVTGEVEVDDELRDLATENLVLEEAYSAGDHVPEHDTVGHGLAPLSPRARGPNFAPVFPSVFPSRPPGPRAQRPTELSAPRAMLPPSPNDVSPQGSPTSSYTGSPSSSHNFSPAGPSSPRSMGQRLLDALSLAGLRGRTARERAKRRRDESCGPDTGRRSSLGHRGAIVGGKMSRAWKSTSAI